LYVPAQGWAARGPPLPFNPKENRPPQHRTARQRRIVNSPLIESVDSIQSKKGLDDCSCVILIVYTWTITNTMLYYPTAVCRLVEETRLQATNRQRNHCLRSGTFAITRTQNTRSLTPVVTYYEPPSCTL
jgi:hypothetical protein